MKKQKGTIIPPSKALEEMKEKYINSLLLFEIYILIAFIIVVIVVVVSVVIALFFQMRTP